MVILIPLALITTVVLVAGLSMRLILGQPLRAEALSTLVTILLWMAGCLSFLMTLITLAAAAWGMNTRLPFALGILQFLVPALSVPAFLLLRFWSVSILSRVFWCLTICNAVAWGLADQAERATSGFRPLSGLERFGTFLNAFTIVLLLVSSLVQLAAVCRHKQRVQVEASVSKEPSPIEKRDFR
jgi:hypothetical protein